MKKKSVWALALAAMLRKYLSGYRSSVGYEFLDSSDW
jgi:hypothetical protein